MEPPFEGLLLVLGLVRHEVGHAVALEHPQRLDRLLHERVD